MRGGRGLTVAGVKNNLCEVVQIRGTHVFFRRIHTRSLLTSQKMRGLACDVKGENNGHRAVSSGHFMARPRRGCLNRCFEQLLGACLLVPHLGTRSLPSLPPLHGKPGGLIREWGERNKEALPNGTEIGDPVCAGVIGGVVRHRGGSGLVGEGRGLGKESGL